MVILKLSNWSACHYIRSDLGPSGAKCVIIGEVSLYPKAFVWQQTEKCSGQEISVVISNMSFYPMSLYPKFTARVQ